MMQRILATNVIEVSSFWWKRKNCQDGKNVPWSNFFEIRCYFSKIAGNSADTAVNLLRTAGEPLS